MCVINWWWWWWMSIIDLYSAESWSISTALCVLSGSDFVFSDCLKLLLLSAGCGDCPVVSSWPWDLQQRRPDDQKCWASNVVRSGDVEWLTVNDVGWECLRLVYSSRPGTQKHCSADSDALWLPVCSEYVLGRRASAIPRAARVTSRGWTCITARGPAAAFSLSCSKYAEVLLTFNAQMVQLNSDCAVLHLNLHNFMTDEL